MEHRSWFHVGGCNQIPSSVLVRSAANVAVLSNGSFFVHLFQVEDSARNAVVKFSSQVCFVAHFLPSSSSAALCCLDDGRAVVLHVTQALARITEAAKYEDASDVFSILLGSSGPSDDEENDRYILNEEEEFCTELVRVTDKVCNAILREQQLILVTKSSSGELKISAHAPCGAQKNIPQFSASPIFVFQLPGSVATLQRSLVPTPPLLLLDSTVLPEEFYRQLCQPDQFLLRSPLVLVGSPAGHVHHLTNTSTPVLFCALNQPVVSIHIIEVPDAAVGDVSPSTCNAIVCIGQRGRTVLCRTGNPGRTAPRFSEFQLNGPILCSVVVPRQYLLYATPDGVYGVRLSSSPSGCQQQTDHSSLEMAFRFPQKMAEIVAHLLMPVDARRVLTASLCGRVATFPVPSEQSRDACTAGDLRRALRCIEANAKQTALLSERLSSLDATLKELNEALTLCCDVARPAPQKVLPLRCKLRPVCVHRGYSSLELAVRLSLECTLQRALGSGWSLLVELRIKSGERRTEAIPLEHLSATNVHQYSVSFPVKPAVRAPLQVSVRCVLHYAIPTRGKSVSFSLHEEVFASTHFLVPCEPSSLQQNASAVIHSARLSFAADVVQRELRNSADLCEKVLDLCILRPAGISPDCIRCGRHEAEVTLRAYNGAPVTVATHLLDNAVEISIRSCSEATVVEISSCVSRAIKEEISGVSDRLPIAELKRELARLQGEMAASGPSSSLKSQIYQLHCRLRGITGISK